MAPANFRIDAWVTPPTYTGKPPVILPGLRPGEPVPAAVAMAVPAGSTLVIRATGQVQLNVVTTGGLERAEVGRADARPRTAPRSAASSSTMPAPPRCAASSSSDVTWQFTAIPDKPPTIALAKDPEGQARGTLQLTYKLEDDYGVVGAQATFKLPRSERHRRPAAARAVRRARLRARAAAGAHQERRRPDHQGSDRASLGRRRRGDDAHRARRGRQRRHRARRSNSGCRSGRSPSRWRAR